MKGLFDGLPPPSARPVVVKPESTAPPAAPEPAKPAIRSKRPADSQNEGRKQVRFKTSAEISQESAIEAMRKIAAHIGNPAKFSKASKLALHLLTTGKVTAETSEVFFTLLDAAMNPPSKATAAAVRVDYQSLFSAVEEILEVFTPPQREQIDLWLLWANLANEFQTDDTFVFSKAAGRLRQAISALPEASSSGSGSGSGEEDVDPSNNSSSSSSGDNPSEVDPFGLNALFQDARKDAGKKDLAGERREALIECLTIATKRYKHQWAQTIIDMTAKHVAENMNRFEGSERERVEKLCLSVKEQQVKRKQGKANTGKLDVSTFEKYRELYAKEKISIRKAVGAAGERSAEQWLG